MLDTVRRYLETQPDVAYALLFGSWARGQARQDSDLDIAVAFTSPVDALRLGALSAAIEALTGLPVDPVLLSEAPAALAWRVFREGQPLLVRDRSAFAARKARAVLDWLDFRPLQERAVEGVLARAARG